MPEETPAALSRFDVARVTVCRFLHDFGPTDQFFILFLRSFLSSSTMTKSSLEEDSSVVEKPAVSHLGMGTR